MPIYEYACQKCGERTEAIQRVSDPPLKKCASCGGKLRKLLSAPAFQFKGSGWYVTDYARKQEKSEAAESKSGEGASQAKEPASKDSGDKAKKTEPKGDTGGSSSSEKSA